MFALEAHRPNVVARLKGSGRKRPLLIMGHTDVVNVDPKKWTHPPFSADRDGGYIYGRGTVDDKDNLTAALMVMLLLKRNNVPLDRDVIFLAEAGEEGATRIGIEYVINQHFGAIDAEYCYAEGGGVTRERGAVRFASVQTVEKIPNGIDLIARGPAGHGSVPLMTNAIAHLSKAVAAVTDWQPPIDLNDTTAAYFSRLAAISPPEQARHYRDVLTGDARAVAAADAWLRENEPRHASMLRTSVSPNIIQGGYRNNVIPSEAKVTLDVRMLPEENPEAFLAQIKKVVNDPSVEAVFNGWPATTTGKPRNGGESSIGSDAFKVIEAAITKHYQTTTLPTMSTGASDMAFLREQGDAVLRRRTGDRHRRWPERVRRAQRSGTNPRSRTLPIRALPLGHRRQPGGKFAAVGSRLSVPIGRTNVRACRPLRLRLTVSKPSPTPSLPSPSRCW